MKKMLALEAATRTESSNLGHKTKIKQELVGVHNVSEPRCQEHKPSKLKAIPFTFKKKKPLPGAYPLQYSPYRMSPRSFVRSPVSLTRPEINDDIQAIRENMARLYQNQYFEEEGAPGQKEPPAKTCSEKIVNRISGAKPLRRRTLVSNVRAPKTAEEERRQIRAAIRASMNPSTPSTSDPPPHRSLGRHKKSPATACPAELGELVMTRGG